MAARSGYSISPKDPCKSVYALLLFYVKLPVMGYK